MKLNQSLTHYSPVLPIYTPWNKRLGFLMFPEGIDKQHWAAMG